jgi:hypothetical protein
MVWRCGTTFFIGATPYDEFLAANQRAEIVHLFVEEKLRNRALHHS